MFVLCVDIEGQKLCHENIRWPYIKLQNTKIDLEGLTSNISKAFRQCKVNCALRARHDGKFPLYELHFTSKQSLKKFVMNSEQMVSELKQSLSPSEKSIPTFQITLTSYLVLLHKGATHKVYLLTKENYQQLSSKFSDSRLFQLKREAFESASKLSFNGILL